MRGSKHIKPLPAPSPGVEKPCCKKLHPEPSRAGRCANKGLAAEGLKRCAPETGDKHFRFLCPVSCGKCRLCPTHPTCAQYKELYTTLGVPPSTAMPYACADSADVELLKGCKTSLKLPPSKALPSELWEAHVRIGRLAVTAGDVTTLSELATNIVGACYDNSTLGAANGPSKASILMPFWRRLHIAPPAGAA